MSVYVTCPFSDFIKGLANLFLNLKFILGLKMWELVRNKILRVTKVCNTKMSFMALHSKKWVNSEADTGASPSERYLNQEEQRKI